MIRRTLHVLAAVAFAAVLVVLPGAAPASAAPATDLCSVKDWQDPSRFADCTKRLQHNAGELVDCKVPPTPDAPDSGVGGIVTRRPDADLKSGISGRYTHYGLGGYQLPIYDLGCAGQITHADAQFETTVANGEFMGASAIVGAANGLRYWAYDPASTWSWSNDLVKTLSDQGFGWLFQPLSVLTFAAVGIYLMWRARKGNLSDTMTTAGWAVLVTVVVIVVARFPSQTTAAADRYGTTALATVQSALGGGPTTVDPAKCPMPDPAACVDQRTVSDRASDTVTEAVLYRSWLSAEFGDANSPTAQKYGPALYDAGTLSWAESATLRAHPEQQPDVVKAKADQWTGIVEQIKVEDPVAYDHIRGLHGWGRVADGAAALCSALAYAAFDLTASLVILLGFAIVRFGVVVLPVLGTVGLFRPAAGDLRKVGNAVVGSLLNIALFGVGAAIFLRIVEAIYGASLGPLMQVLAVAALDAALLLWLRPWRRVLVGHRRADGDSDGGGRVRGLFRRANRASTGAPVDPPAAAAPPEAPVSPAVAPRPEAHTPAVRPVPQGQRTPTSPPAAARPRPEAFTGSMK